MARRARNTGGLGCLLLLVLLVGGAGWLFVHRGWTGAGPLDKPAVVRVPEGATLAGTARALEKAGAVRSTTGFLRFVRWFGKPGPIRAGEYRLPAHASARDVYAILQSGKTVLRLVTVPEGMPSVLVRARLAAEDQLTGTVALPAEGSVLPDSYSYELGEERAAVLLRMQAAMTRALEAAWAQRKPATVAKTKAEAVILASIVEKETALPAERRLVAAVYSNRLRQGMKLQADPTVIYPITQGRPLGRRIRRSELNAVNGYNTYAEAGLPKGPICNPGRASIAAVLDPAPTKALYFVADGKGGHVFADTLSEHNANVKRWFALRRARGEM